METLLKYDELVLYSTPTFRAPRTHKETASFALRSTCDFVVRSSVNAMSCNSLHVKADSVNCHYLHTLLRWCTILGYYSYVHKNIVKQLLIYDNRIKTP